MSWKGKSHQDIFNYYYSGDHASIKGTQVKFVKMTFWGYFYLWIAEKWVLFIIRGSWVEQDCGPSKITFLTVVTLSCTSHLPSSSPYIYILYTGILYIHTLLTPFAYYRVIFMGNKKNHVSPISVTCFSSFGWKYITTCNSELPVQIFIFVFHFLGYSSQN